MNKMIIISHYRSSFTQANYRGCFGQVKHKKTLTVPRKILRILALEVKAYQRNFIAS